MLLLIFSFRPIIRVSGLEDAEARHLLPPVPSTRPFPRAKLISTTTCFLVFSSGERLTPDFCMRDGRQRRHQQQTYQKIPRFAAHLLVFLLHKVRVFPASPGCDYLFLASSHQSLLHQFHLRYGRAGISRLGDAAPHRSTCSVHLLCPLILATTSGINRLSSKLSNEERFIIYYCHFESGTKSNRIQSTQAKQAKPSQTRFLPFTMIRDASAIHGSPKAKSLLKTPHHQKTPKSLQLIVLIILPHWLSKKENTKSVPENIPY